ncbi:MAG: hypothetical protein QNL12_12910 [Acidimicrobiia bacterium]|nr:hypothetical protein [Acidimicrobiia bacterium]MDX2468211.1 hypothetical protein [Acidimicrobiia bacterium]
MNDRFKKLGYALIAIGLVFVIGGGYAYSQTQAGYTSLQKFSEAQDVNLSYNDEGQLVDRGTPEGAAAIMDLLKNEWGYPVLDSEMDSNDPLVNTGSEYMFQMATVTFHTLHGTQTVVLDEPVEYNGESFAAGVYEVPVDGKYWTAFDRQHPLEGPARSQAWSGTAHGIVGELGVGTVTHSALKMGLGIAGMLAGIGATTILTGLGLVWAVGGVNRKESPNFVTDADVKKEMADV